MSTKPSQKERFMREAIRLERKACGRTRPNPQVGAVVVKGGQIVGSGYHKRAGLPHAEIEALKEAGKLARGAELYVTLEPCVHFGRTPPCVDSIIESGIKKVYVGTLDPNPVVHKKGVKKLRAAGVDVEYGILEGECRNLNEGYNVCISRSRPHVTLKIAATLDGNIADFNFRSKWITSESSRRFVHRLRAASDAVLVGINTVLFDDPLLTARDARAPKGQPLRVVLDERLRIPKNAKILGGEAKTLLVTSKQRIDARKETKLKELAEIVRLKASGGLIDLNALLSELARRDVQSLLVEGGATVFSSFIKGGLWDRIYLFIAPVILGEGIKWSKDIKLELGNAKCVRLEKVKKVGGDLLLVLEREG